MASFAGDPSAMPASPHHPGRRGSIPSEFASAEHFVQGSGKSAMIKEATRGPCANQILIRSMQHLRKPGLIPVKSRSRQRIIVGQVQVTRMPMLGTLHVLAWHSVRRPQLLEA